LMDISLYVSNTMSILVLCGPPSFKAIVKKVLATLPNVV